HIEPRIAAGKLEARGQEDAAAVVKRMGQRVVLALIRADPGLALDANAAAGRIAGALHRGPSVLAPPRRDLWSPGQKWRRPPGAPRRPCGIKIAWPPGLHGPPPTGCMRKSVHGFTVAGGHGGRNRPVRLRPGQTA